MKRLDVSRVLLAFVLVSLAVSLLPPEAALAAGNKDPYDGLTDTEKAYVVQLEMAYAQAHAAVDKLKAAIVGEGLSMLLGAEAKPEEIVKGVLDCSAELDRIAPVFHQSPPSSMISLVDANQNVAATLEGAFDSTAGLAMNEGIDRVLETGRNFLGSLLGAPPKPVEEDTSFKARILASINSEIGRVEAALGAGEAALSAAVTEVQETQAMGEDFLEAFLNGDCFIATAAYGTPSAEQIDVLRDFRDNVLEMSPAGRDLIDFYYAASPPLASYIREHPALRTIVRECVVDPIVWMVGHSDSLWELS